MTMTRLDPPNTADSRIVDKLWRKAFVASNYFPLHPVLGRMRWIKGLSPDTEHA